MNNSNKCGIEDLFQLFEEALSPSDVLFSKLMAQISTAITKERLRLGMSQADFAKHIESSQSLISRWEHGDYNFTIKKIADIAARLDLDVNIEMKSLASCQNVENFSNQQDFSKPTTSRYSDTSFSRSLNNAYNNIIPFTTLQTKYKEENYYASIR